MKSAWISLGLIAALVGAAACFTTPKEPERQIYDTSLRVSVSVEDFTMSYEL